MKLKLIVMAGLLCSSPAIFALDLQQAYARAQQNDPNWQANLLQYQADQLNLGIASGNLLPTVTLSGNVTRKNQSTDPQFASLTTSSTTTSHVADTARQTLFRWAAWLGYRSVVSR